MKQYLLQVPEKSKQYKNSSFIISLWQRVHRKSSFDDSMKTAY